MVLVPGPYAPNHKVRLQSNFGDAPRCCCRLRPTERNVTQISNHFQENPETIFQFVFDQPLFAFRIQRPAFDPLFKLPSASQKENRPFSVTSPLLSYKGKAPLSGCRLPFTPRAVRRNAGDDMPARIANASARIQNPETANHAIVQKAQGQPGSLSACA